MVDGRGVEANVGVDICQIQRLHGLLLHKSNRGAANLILS